MISDNPIIITDKMRIAAKSVSVAHEHYVENCHIMSSLKGKPDAMKVAIGERKKAHVAYHLALGFLKEATIQANPVFRNIDDKDSEEAIYNWADAQLGKLIVDSAEKKPIEATDHRVLREPEDWRWE